MTCQRFDEQVVRLDKIADLAERFVLVRLGKITEVDLRLFDFDYDLTWAALFLNAEGTVYGRYGSRDAGKAEGRMSLKGLRYAMKAALAAHRKRPRGQVAARAKAPELAENYPAAKPLLIRGGCLHCHQVYEFRRAQLQAADKWRRADAWVYPLPENVGLTLDVDRGDRVRSVAAGSPAQRAGLRPGDILQRLNGVAVAALADAQYGLHRAQARGTISVSWRRGHKTMSGKLELKEGWRKTDLTWRPSLRELVPSLTLRGRDLSVAEKKALGLSARKLAFQQGKAVSSQAQDAGIRAQDVIIGIDNGFPEMTRERFLAYIRRSYLVGDRVTLHILRAGKRLDVPLTLR